MNRYRNIRSRSYSHYKTDSIEEEAQQFLQEYSVILNLWNRTDANQIDVDYYNEAATVANHSDTLFKDIQTKKKVIQDFVEKMRYLLDRYKYTLNRENSPEYAEAENVTNEMADVLIVYYDTIVAFKELRDVLSRYTTAVGEASGATR
jgi:hypothetical protein